MLKPQCVNFYMWSFRLFSRHTWKILDNSRENIVLLVSHSCSLSGSGLVLSSSVFFDSTTGWHQRQKTIKFDNAALNVSPWQYYVTIVMIHNWLNNNDKNYMWVLKSWQLHWQLKKKLYLKDQLVAWQYFVHEGLYSGAAGQDCVHCCVSRFGAINGRAHPCSPPSLSSPLLAVMHSVWKCDHV